jgi:hypothetical protein
MITDTEEVQLRQYHHSTWSLVSKKLKIVTAAQGRYLKYSVDVWFVTGLHDILTSFERVGQTLAILRVIQCGRRRPANTKDCMWFSVSHESVGGSTTARGGFGRISLVNLTMEVDPLRRTISHVMKFLIRPSPCHIPCLEERHYPLLPDRLSLTRLHQPVVYETGFSRTAGWEKCELTDVEFAQVFDLPSYIPWNPEYAFSLVPVQIFRSIVDAVLETLRRRDHQPPRVRVRLASASTASLPLDAEWLPTLGAWLPGSWAHTEIAGNASSPMTRNWNTSLGISVLYWSFRPATLMPSTILSCSGSRLGIKGWLSPFWLT